MNTEGNTEQYFSLPPTEFKLYREMLGVQAKAEAYQFVWKYRTDRQAIQMEINEQEELFDVLSAGPMSPGASPRVYKDAYVAGLREALSLLLFD